MVVAHVTLQIAATREEKRSLHTRVAISIGNRVRSYDFIPTGKGIRRNDDSIAGFSIREGSFADRSILDSQIDVNESFNPWIRSSRSDKEPRTMLAQDKSSTV